MFQYIKTLKHTKSVISLYIFIKVCKKIFFWWKSKKCCFAVFLYVRYYKIKELHFFLCFFFVFCFLY